MQYDDLVIKVKELEQWAIVHDKYCAVKDTKVDSVVNALVDETKVLKRRWWRLLIYGLVVSASANVSLIMFILELKGLL